MSNTLSSTWVKNVYTVGKRVGISGEKLYTGIHQIATYPHQPWVQPTFSTHLSNSFTPNLYTRIFRFLPLVITRLYTVSTVPTITKAKEK